MSLCDDDANAWRDFYFLNCNKKFLCLSASLVDFLHVLASSRQPNSRQLPSVELDNSDVNFLQCFCLLSKLVSEHDH